MIKQYAWLANIPSFLYMFFRQTLFGESIGINPKNIEYKKYVILHLLSNH